MKLDQLSEDGVLDYKGDVAHPATPQGAPTHVPNAGVAGCGVDMSAKEEPETLANQALKKKKRPTGLSPRASYVTARNKRQNRRKLGS